jgi:hypothetical protein
MAELVQFQLADGSTVLVQSDAGPAAGADGEHVAVRGWRDRGASAAGSTMVAASTSFEQAVERVRPAAESLVERFRNVAGGPDEMSVEFDLQMSAEFGAYIAQASATANFKVTLTWRK